MSNPISPKIRVASGSSCARIFGLEFPLWQVAGALGLATILIYWPATGCGFINFDDDLYVTSNTHVQQGLTFSNVKWAFLSIIASNWHPLTTLSHMMDCQCFGPNPWGHHLTSVLFHAANSVLVFLLLHRLTGAVLRSASVAALFAVHPLHVESVAWISERKDVLSGFFGLLCLIVYARFAQTRVRIESQAGAGIIQPQDVQQQAVYYWLAFSFLALGLMSKAMLVTWPFVMLLLDYWPLGRFKSCSTARLIIEKIPFFALVLVVSAVTLAVQHQAGAVATGGQLPFGARIENALVSYGRYLRMLFWPVKLAVFYPLPVHWPAGEVLLVAAALGAVSIMVLLKRRNYPFLPVGWFWFVGTLVPVIGLVQAGDQALADRYMYLPSLGLLILIVWGAFELTRRWSGQALALSVAGTVTASLCIALTLQQLGCWKDSETLFRHALDVTTGNYIADNNLGVVLVDEGQFDEAISRLQEAVRLKPYDVPAIFNLGNALYATGQFDDAIGKYQDALRLDPRNPNIHLNLGNAFFKEKYFDKAIACYQEVVRLDPGNPLARNNLGQTLAKKGRTDDAIVQYREAIRLKSDYADAHNNLGYVLQSKGHIQEAIDQYQEALRIRPDDALAQNNLDNALKILGSPANSK